MGFERFPGTESDAGSLLIDAEEGCFGITRSDGRDAGAALRLLLIGMLFVPVSRAAG